MEQTKNEQQPGGITDAVKLMTDEQVLDMLTTLLTEGRVNIRVGFLPTASVMEEIKDDFLRYQMTVVEVGDLASASEPRPLTKAFKPVYEEVPETLN